MLAGGIDVDVDFRDPKEVVDHAAYLERNAEEACSGVVGGVRLTNLSSSRVMGSSTGG
jgi:hypothetical protein